MTWIVTVYGTPVTKKNSGVIARVKRTGRPFLLPSAQWRRWCVTARIERGAGWQTEQALTADVNLRAVFYRERRVGDLLGYLDGLADLLEQRRIVVNDRQFVGFDGSRLDYDKGNPRVELVMELAQAEDCL
jgi:hypothetical protein